MAPEVYTGNLELVLHGSSSVLRYRPPRQEESLRKVVLKNQYEQTLGRNHISSVKI